MGAVTGAVNELFRRRFGYGAVAELKLLKHHKRDWLRVRRLERKLGRQLAPLGRAGVATIVPTLGRPGLPDAVSSALAQGFDGGHRVVVVSDGPVGLPPLPKDERVSVVALPEAIKCPGAMRNIGMSLVSSDYVAFLDEDNTWERDHLSTSIKALDQSGADISYSSCRCVTAQGGTADMWGGAWDHRRLGDKNYVDTSGIVIRRRHRYAWSRYPHGTRGKDGFAEDWALMFWYGFFRRVVFTGKATVNYTLGEKHLGAGARAGPAGLSSALAGGRRPAAP
ncbi:MAG: glycosyltransferase family 2 protein [Acidimicrobiales bacterium]